MSSDVASRLTVRDARVTVDPQGRILRDLGIIEKERRLCSDGMPDGSVNMLAGMYILGKIRDYFGSNLEGYSGFLDLMEQSGLNSNHAISRAAEYAKMDIGYLIELVRKNDDKLHKFIAGEEVSREDPETLPIEHRLFLFHRGDDEVEEILNQIRNECFEGRDDLFVIFLDNLQDFDIRYTDIARAFAFADNDSARFVEMVNSYDVFLFYHINEQRDIYANKADAVLQQREGEKGQKNGVG